MIAQAVKVHRLIQADRQRLVDENTHLRQELKERYDFSNLVGTSGPMRQVYEQVAQVARTNTTVLLRGESGTGKELIAHAIHYNSPRAKKPFIKVSCAALPHDLIESELFGYEKGAFTGAHGVEERALRARRRRHAVPRRDRRAEPGDAGEAAARAAGARVRAAGRHRDRSAPNIRLVAATNKDLEKAIAAGEFREDLYYRLNVFAIFVPPLRERKPDILLLADHFLEKFAREHGKDVQAHLDAGDRHAGELSLAGQRPRAGQRHRARRGRLRRPGAARAPSAADAADRRGVRHRSDALAARGRSKPFEKDALQDALKSARGNRAKAARLLATTERIFNYRVRKLGIDWRRFKD